MLQIFSLNSDKGKTVLLEPNRYKKAAQIKDKK